MTKRITMQERWAAEEELLAEHPLEVDEEPRFEADNLEGYDGPPEPTVDESNPR